MIAYSQVATAVWSLLKGCPTWVTQLLLLRAAEHTAIKRVRGDWPPDIVAMTKMLAVQQKKASQVLICLS